MTPNSDLALRLCTYCPKLCRFSCPVSEATGKETLSPWGKMSSLARTLGKKTHPSPSAALVPYACTGCLRCQNYCRHGVDVPDSLFPGRAPSVKAGLMPQEIRNTLSSFSRRKPALQDLIDTWPEEGEWKFHPGCSALANPTVFSDTKEVLDKLSAKTFGSVGKEIECCGYPLYAAGAIDDFIAHGKKHGPKLQGKQIVLGDPGCAFTLKTLYPRYQIPSAKEVKHIVELIVPLLPPKPSVTLSKPRYHDACYLGRHLGIFEEPRQMLLWACGEDPEELAHAKQDALCSGGGGLLPKTDPDTALRIAKDLVFLANEPLNEAPIVTACPTAKQMLTKAGAETFDWMSWLKKAL